MIMIKAARKAIHAVLREGEIDDEELMTAFIGAESFLNSRPITFQTANPSDTTSLTPNHFLHGQIGGQFAPDSVDGNKFHPRKRWRRVQELISHFWRRWMMDERMASRSIRSFEMERSERRFKGWRCRACHFFLTNPEPIVHLDESSKSTLDRINMFELLN